MTRRRDALYSGAIGRATLGQAVSAGLRYAAVPKYDGSYCTATTDARGRLAHLVSRNGNSFPRSVTDELRGVMWAPDSVLTGELECWTEASNRMAAIRGFRMVHLFDCIRVGGRDVSSLPYRDRRDALLTAESSLVNEDLDRPWAQDGKGDAHDPTTGRYVRPVPMSWRRIRVVPQLSAADAEIAWREWVELDRAGGPAEGLVLVALDAPLGRRGSKRKVKDTRSIDATVVGVGKGAVRVAWRGYSFAISAVGRQVDVGDVIEIQHDGWNERSVQPKSARIVRVRSDLRRAA